MTRSTCPSCGAPFNGKKCRSCLYETFTEEYAHGNHTHQGEPLVIDAPVRSPIPKQDPFECPPKRTAPGPARQYHREKALFRPLFIFLLLAAIGIFSSAISVFISRSNFQRSQPTPDLSNLTVLYADDQYTIRSDFQEGQTYGQGFHIYLENNTRRAVTLYADKLIVNGYLIDHSPLYCAAKRRGSGWDAFQIDGEALAKAGIEQVETLSFSLGIYDSQSYKNLLETQTFQLHTAVPEGFVQNVDDSGQLLLDEAGVRILYRGYVPNELYPEQFLLASLDFFLENNTDRTLTFSIARVDSAETQVCTASDTLPPHTRAIAPMYLFPLEKLNLTSLEELGQITLTLSVYDFDASDFLITSEAVIAPSGAQ